MEKVIITVLSPFRSLPPEYKVFADYQDAVPIMVQQRLPNGMWVHVYSATKRVTVNH